MARVATALAVATCALGGNAAARDLQDVLNAGTLRVGVTLFAPWAARGAGGELVGFEVDVARQLAADMDVQAQFLTYDVDRLIPALESGEIDLIAAGMTITPERALHVNFSKPYAESGIGLATHVARTASVTDATALDSETYTIAAVEDSVGAQLARRLWPRARVQIFASVEAASEALLAGEVHGYVEDEPVPTFLALENPGVIDVPTGRPLLASPAGFAVGKGDPDFLAFLNAWITAREADTWLPTTAGYWFESLRWRERLGDARP
jgi:polar amino acid transport system substrate-binding protein